MVETLLTYKGVAVIAWFALFFAAERMIPAAPGPLGDKRRIGRNLGLWLGNAALSLAVVVPVTLWATDQALSWRPAWYSGATGLGLDIVLLDFWIYWWHRANHWIPFLWRFHQVHHLDRFLDTTSAVRFHFGEVLLSALARALVIALLGLPIASVLVFEAIVLSAAIFHHANLRLPRGFEALLSRVIITPSIHWVHHRRVRRDTDSNYGTMFSFWDRLFGSASPTARTMDMEIGVEGREEEGIAGLLIRPLRR